MKRDLSSEVWIVWLISGTFFNPRAQGVLPPSCWWCLGYITCFRLICNFTEKCPVVPYFLMFWIQNSDRFRAQLLTWSCPNWKKAGKSALEIENFFLKLHFFFLWPRKKKVIWICQNLTSMQQYLKKGANSVNFIFGPIVVAHISKRIFGELNFLCWNLCCHTGFYNLLWFTHYFVFTQSRYFAFKINCTIVILGNSTKKV